MANPVTINFTRSDTGGKAWLNGMVTASYTRSGSAVTITVVTEVTSGGGKYYNVTIDGTKVIAEKTGKVTKTYTYNDAAAKTYSFKVVTYIQTATSYAGYDQTQTLTIDVPAASGQAYVKVGGAWEKGSENYVKVSGAQKTGIIKVKVEGAWK